MRKTSPPGTPNWRRSVLCPCPAIPTRSPTSPPGRYRVVFGASLPAYYFTQYYDDRDLESEAQEVLVKSGQTAGQIDAALIANPGPWEGAIAGTVTDSSSKAAIAGIQACPVRVGSTTIAG